MQLSPFARALTAVRLLAGGTAGEGEFSFVRYRSFPLDKYDTTELEAEDRRPHQDSYRPDAPGNSSPGSRYKP